MLILDLDSLRADNLGCYGYHRNTSPNIDKVAEEGVRFTNYYTSDAPCLPSRTSLMTGQFGIHHGAVGHGGTAADLRHEGTKRDFQDRLVQESLAGFLRSEGLKTTLISPFLKGIPLGILMQDLMRFIIQVIVAWNLLKKLRLLF